MRSLATSQSRPVLRALALAAVWLLQSADAEPLRGGTFQLIGTTTGGSVRAGGGGFQVEGAVGQPDTGTSRGGPFTVTGGILGVVIVPGDVALRVEKTEDGQAKLSWTAEAAGFQLQFATTLGTAPDWKPVEPVPDGNIFITPADQPLRFFRLHKP